MLTDQYLSFSSARPVSAGPALQESRIDELRAILGDARLDAVLGLLLGECRERPSRLRLCHARGDLAALIAETNSLLGAANTLGATALGDAALALTSSCDMSHALPLIEAIDEAAQATLRAARHLLGTTLPLAANA